MVLSVDYSSFCPEVWLLLPTPRWSVPEILGSLLTCRHRQLFATGCTNGNVYLYCGDASEPRWCFASSFPRRGHALRSIRGQSASNYIKSMPDIAELRCHIFTSRG